MTIQNTPVDEQYAANRFSCRYIEFNARAESLMTFIREGEVKKRQAGRVVEFSERIVDFAGSWDEFLTELRSRAEILKLKSTCFEVESIDIFLNGLCESLSRLAYERMSDEDSWRVLSSLIFHAEFLYSRIMVCGYAKCCEGHHDAARGCWIWDDLKFCKSDFNILRYYAEQNGWTLNKQYIEAMRERHNYGDTTLYNRRDILIHYGLIEEKSQNSTLYRITESGIHYTSQKSSC